VDVGLDGLERRARLLTGGRRQRWAGLAGKLEALSPLATLARGYAVARSREGDILNTVAAFTPGRGFHLRVRDGTVAAEAIGPVEDAHA
jgi:exodeoxyribonuclease VII large subunit